MNRRELVAALAERSAVDRRTVDDVLSAFVEEVSTQVAAGEPVVLTGFCKFSRKDVAAKPARDGINPFTREPQRFAAKPASKSVRITPLKHLKDRVAAPPAKKTAKKSAKKAR